MVTDIKGEIKFLNTLSACRLAKKTLCSMKLFCYINKEYSFLLNYCSPLVNPGDYREPEPQHGYLILRISVTEILTLIVLVPLTL
jgi:hypothetical protein